MLTFNLLQVLKTRWVKFPYGFLVKNGISVTLANKMANERIRAIRLDHIEKLCLLLNCTPNDLFRFAPDKAQLVPEGHAMKQLIAKREEQEVVEWLTELHSLPLSEMKKLARERKKEL